VKWVFLVLLLITIIPLSDWLRRNPREIPKFWMLMGFLPFVLANFHSYMAIISQTEWPGLVKGTEFSIFDALALALYLGLRGGRYSLPFRYSMALYFLATLFASLGAVVPVAALFYSWQLARMFLVYAIVARASVDPRVVTAILNGMAVAMIMEAIVTSWQRFGSGILQTHGTFIHQNSLGLVSHFVVLPCFALILAGRRGWLLPTAVLAGGIVQVLTTSRGTIAFAAFGYASVFLLSALRQWSARKAQILLICAVTTTMLAPLALASLENRFAPYDSSIATDENNYDERAAWEKAAAMMLSDHPFGVGANHFIYSGNVDGYFEAAGVASVYGSRSNNVHNIYWLVAAETGYLGVITFSFLLLRTLVFAFVCGWRARGDERGDLLLGLGVALLTVYLHSFFEWIFVAFQSQYIWVLNLGMVAGLARQLGYPNRANWRDVRPLRRAGEGAVLGPVVPPSVAAPRSVR
jgi:hypothetical protein